MSNFRYIVPEQQRSTISVHSDVITDVLVELRSAPQAITLVASNGLGKTTTMLTIASALRDSVAMTSRYRAAIWLPVGQWRVRTTALEKADALVTSLRDLISAIGAGIGHPELGTFPPPVQTMALYAALAEYPVILFVDDLDQIWEPAIDAFFANLPSPTIVVASSTRDLGYGLVYTLQRLEAATLVSILSEASSTWGQLDSRTKTTLVDAANGNPHIARILASHAIATTEIQSLSHALDAIHPQVLDYFVGSALEGSSLSHNELLALELLALPPLPISLTAIHHMFQHARLASSISDTQVILDRLQHHGHLMTTISGKEVRHSVPLVVRRYLAGVTDEASAFGAFAPALQHEASIALNHTRYSRAFDLLASDHQNIVELLRHAAVTSDGDVRMNAATTLAAISAYLHCRGHWDELIEHTSWACSHLINGGQLRDACLLGTVWTARCLILRGKTTDARDIISDIRAQLPPSDEVGLASAIVDFGATMIPDCPKSHLDNLNRLATLFHQQGDDELLAMVLNRLGNRSAELGELQTSDRYYHQVSTIVRSHRHDAWAYELRAIALGNQGINANRRNDYHRAISVLRIARTHIEQLRDRATATMELAIAYYGIGNQRLAATYASHARRLVDGLQIVGSIGESHRELEHRLLGAV